MWLFKRNGRRLTLNVNPKVDVSNQCCGFSRPLWRNAAQGVLMGLADNRRLPNPNVYIAQVVGWRPLNLESKLRQDGQLAYKAWIGPSGRKSQEEKKGESRFEECLLSGNKCILHTIMNIFSGPEVEEWWLHFSCHFCANSHYAFWHCHRVGPAAVVNTSL